VHRRYVDARAPGASASTEFIRLLSKVLRRGMLLAASAFPAIAWADQEPAVLTELVAEVRETVRTPEGREVYRFLPATLLSQGAVVYYTVRIQNTTAASMPSVEVTQRIPANTTYVLGSAAGPSAEVLLSADGGATFEAEQRRKARAAGDVEDEDPARYTHIRWRLRYPLAAGAVALARFRAVFN
jgi:uncharacterized repeat protein (TIGR01451 family)